MKGGDEARELLGNYTGFSSRHSVKLAGQVPGMGDVSSVSILKNYKKRFLHLWFVKTLCTSIPEITHTHTHTFLHTHTYTHTHKTDRIVSKVVSDILSDVADEGKDQIQKSVNPTVKHRSLCQ